MILISYGTRPEFIKINPLLKEFELRGINYKTVCVAQHTSLLDQPFDIKIPVKEHSDNRLDSIVTSVLNQNSLFGEVSHVLVQGDTTAAMSMALAAFHRRIPIIHVEAGLRTYDPQSPYPEEANRRIISALATYHMCPTKQEKLKLVIEGVDDSSIYVTGNTSLDNLRDIEPTQNNEVIVTLHRRENLENIRDWFVAIEKLAKETFYDFIFSMHPNPDIQKYKEVFESVTVCDPIPFDDMKVRLAECSMVITDSGGIQEECSWFNKVCFVCRSSTERYCDSSIMCSSPEELLNEFRKLQTNKIDYDCPFGDGFAAEKIADAIENL